MNRKRSQIPYRNKSPYGWWLAAYVERFELDDEDTSNDRRRCLAWENTILIHAKSREGAYKKAIRAGKLSEGRTAQTEDGRKGKWRFDGLTSLLPIYEELEDGAEIVWMEHRGKMVKSIKAMVREKHKLEAFDDSEI